MQITERKSLFSRRLSWSEQNSCCVWSNSPVHLDCSLVFLTKLILILIQFFQCHVLICFDCMDKKNVLKNEISKIEKGLCREIFANSSTRVTWRDNVKLQIQQDLLSPTDCCCRASSSSSSSSLGTSLGGRIPFFLRISFHSVSSFGSYGKYVTNTHG